MQLGKEVVALIVIVSGYVMKLRDVEGRGTPESIVIPTELVIRESVSSVRTLS